jgi:hypothetical protein
MSKKIEWGSDEEFIANYNKLKSSRLMAELYGCGKTAVLNHAKAINFSTNSISREYKLSNQDKENIIAAYNSDKTSGDLAEEYGVSRGMITKLWYDAGLQGKQSSHAKLDLTGKQINNLTVLQKTDQRDASGCVMWLCKCTCGNTTLVSSSRLNQGIAKSCGCLSKAALEKGRGLNYQDLSGQIFGKLTVLERCEDKIDLNEYHSVQFLCRCECGRVTKVLSSNLKSGNTQSCGFCGNNSHGNIAIEKLLTNNNIPFEREKRFETCKDKNCLPFDFYINNQYLIEFDGKQHFTNQNTFFNSEETQRHDKIKNEWCKNNNIPLIRIPYTHLEDLCIEDLLLETSKFII